MISSSTSDGRSDARSAIIDAAVRLLRENGASAVTTRAVAHAAGVPAPKIFRLFGDKDGLLEAVAEQVMATYVAKKSTQAENEDGDPVDDLRAGWRSQIEFGLANPDLFTLLAGPGPLQHAPATTTGTEVLTARVARLAAAGLLRVSVSRAVDMIRAAGTGVVLTLLTTPEAERDPALAEAMLDTVLGHILTSTPAPSAADPIALAAAFQTTVADLPALSDGERGLLAEWLERAIDGWQV